MEKEIYIYKNIYNVTVRVFLRPGSKSCCKYLAQSEKKGSILVLQNRISKMAQIIIDLSVQHQCREKNNRTSVMEVNQERAKRIKYSRCWFAKLITSFLDKIPASKVPQGAQGHSSSTQGPGQRGCALRRPCSRSQWHFQTP